MDTDKRPAYAWETQRSSLYKRRVISAVNSHTLNRLITVRYILDDSSGSRVRCFFFKISHLWNSSYNGWTESITLSTRKFAVLGWVYAMLTHIQKAIHQAPFRTYAIIHQEYNFLGRAMLLAVTWLRHINVVAYRVLVALRSERNDEAFASVLSLKNTPIS